MFDWFSGKKSGSRLGIDLGSAAIKVVELVEKDRRLHLVNYALAQAKDESIFKIGELKDEEMAKILKSLLDQAGIKTRLASIALPVDKTFSTTIELPSMSAPELKSAIYFEAHKYVPVPLTEVELDCSVLTPLQEVAAAKNPPSGDKGEVMDSAVNSLKKDTKNPTTQILLVAVPKNIINRLTKIANLAGLQVAALEQEAFSLARALVGNDQQTYLVIDFGRRGSDLIIVDQGLIRLSHNLESVNQEILLMEIERIVNLYQMRYNRKAGQCLLAGGRAGRSELFEFLSGRLKMPVKVGDPFARVAYQPELSSAVKELGSQFSVAVGLAMRE